MNHLLTAGMKIRPEHHIILQEILDRMASNDQAALKELYQCFSARLFEFAYGIIHSREMAEEIMEDVFIQIWHHRVRVRTIENITWYLFITTRNISFNYLKKYAKNKRLNLDSISLPYYEIDANPEEILISREALHRINKTINELPPRCLLIFKLVKEDGLKYKEVAELLEINIKTVENQMAIALKKLHHTIRAGIRHSGASE